MPNFEPKPWVQQYTKEYFERVQLYASKMNRILATQKKQFFPMEKHFYVEEILDVGEVILIEFRLTPPMQALVREQWLLQDEAFRYEDKYEQTGDLGYRLVQKRLEARMELVHELFLQLLRKPEQSRKVFYLFIHTETSLHITCDWMCHIVGYPDTLKR